MSRLASWSGHWLRPFFAVLILAAVVQPALGAELKVSATSLSFVAPAGASPAAQSLIVSSDPALPGFSPAVTASSQPGNWLSVSTAAGGSYAGSITVTVGVSSANLPLGDYAGQITVTSPGLTGSPVSVNVSLKVVSPGPYLSANPAAIEVQARVGVDPAPVFISITNTGTGTISPSFSASANGGNWLSVTQTTGGSFSSSASARVDIRSASLPAGNYTGTVTVASAGATNSPLNVPVSLKVGDSGGIVLNVSPSSLSFLAGLGANPLGQGLTVNNAGSGTMRPTVNHSTASGGTWLAVNSLGGGTFQGPMSLTVSADIGGLNKGTYSGAITVSDPSAANSPVQVPVTLTVEDPKPVIRLLNKSLAFGTDAGDFRTGTSTFVFNTGTGLLHWQATVSYENGSNWIEIEPTAGETALLSAVIVAVRSKGLAAGIYKGEIRFASDTVSGDNPAKVQVTLAVGVPIPLVNNSGIVNAATFAPQAAAPGSIVSIFGRKLGPAAGEIAQFAGGRLPTQLANVRVLFNGGPAPLYFAREDQLNVQVPAELAGENSAQVQVLHNGVPGAEYTLNLRPADPGIFVIGGRPAVVFSNTSTLVSSEARAKPDDYLTIYATGLGALETPLESGVAPSTAIRTVQAPVVTLGGVPATVLYSGVTPGFVGLYQINVQVPNGVMSGNNNLIIGMGNAESAPMAVPVL